MLRVSTLIRVAQILIPGYSASLPHPSSNLASSFPIGSVEFPLLQCYPFLVTVVYFSALTFPFSMAPRVDTSIKREEEQNHPPRAPFVPELRLFAMEDDRGNRWVEDLELEHEVHNGFNGLDHDDSEEDEVEDYIEEWHVRHEEMEADFLEHVWDPIRDQFRIFPEDDAPPSPL